MLSKITDGLMWIVDQATHIISLYAEWINHIAGGNDFLAGTLSIMLPSIVMAAIWFVPRRVTNWVKSRYIVCLTLNSQDLGTYQFKFALYGLNSLTENNKLFRWTNRGYKMYIRHIENPLRLSSVYRKSNRGRDEVFLTQADNTDSWLLLGFRPYRIRVERTENPVAGGEYVSKVHIRTFGISLSCFDKILSKINAEVIEPTDSSIVRLSVDGSYSSEISCAQSLDELCLNAEVRKSLKNVLDGYTNDVAYKESIRLGLPHRLVLMLHGEPGNGKSRLISAIAKYLDLNVNYVQLEGMYSGSTLLDAIGDPDSIHIMEDVHSVEAFNKGGAAGIVKYQKESDSKAVLPSNQDTSVGEVPLLSNGKASNNTQKMFESSLSLSAFLNILNGVNPLDRKVIIMTTNYIDDLRPELFRPARVDYVIEVPRISPDTVNAWLTERLPGFNSCKGFTKEVRGCDINTLLTRARSTYAEDFDSMIQEIERKIPPKQAFTYKDSNVLELG